MFKSLAICYFAPLTSTKQCSTVQLFLSTNISKGSLAASVRISANTNQSRVSHLVRMRENGAEVYPKQSSLDQSFYIVKELLLEERTL